MHLFVCMINSLGCCATTLYQSFDEVVVQLYRRNAGYSIWLFKLRGCRAWVNICHFVEWRILIIIYISVGKEGLEGTRITGNLVSPTLTVHNTIYTQLPMKVVHMINKPLFHHAGKVSSSYEIQGSVWKCGNIAKQFEYMSTAKSLHVITQLTLNPIKEYSHLPCSPKNCAKFIHTFHVNVMF